MSRKLFKPGQSGNPAGRRPGTPNKRTTLMRDKAEELGVDPMEVVLLFAKGDWRALGYKEETFISSTSEFGNTIEYTIPPVLRAKCAMDAIQYIAPKLKSIEHVKENPMDGLTGEQKLEMMKAAMKALEDDVKRTRDVGNGSGDSKPKEIQS